MGYCPFIESIKTEYYLDNSKIRVIHVHCVTFIPKLDSTSTGAVAQISYSNSKYIGSLAEIIIFF